MSFQAKLGEVAFAASDILQREPVVLRLWYDPATGVYADHLDKRVFKADPEQLIEVDEEGLATVRDAALWLRKIEFGISERVVSLWDIEQLRQRQTFRRRNSP